MAADGTRAQDQARPATGAGVAHAHASAASPDPVEQRPQRSLIERAKALLAWWQHTRVARANARFGARGGGVLTGGIAYSALFSVFAALTIGYTVFMAVLGNNDALRQRVLEAIDASLPGLIDTGDREGMINPSDLQLSDGLTLTGVVAVVVLLVSALAAMAALRTAVRAMFSDQGGGGNVVLGKARELGGFAGMAFAVLLSAVVTTAVGSVASWVLDALGWEGSTKVVLRGTGILVSFVIDAAIFLLLVKVLAAENPPWRDLRWGAVIAATGIGIVRILGTSVVAGSVSRNPLFTSVAVIVTLLVWVNLIARIVLLAAAWTADPPFVDPAAKDAADEDAPAV
ncbi:YihY/virulence factor BrkB family protein [Cellulomonas fengjieae]|uniref:YihY/virulence factor BrkB family protein n=1 Tax=Cellulomonas fengjieae TaxID=2819978 RepID=A0ABS3SL91_9CELL|nr:YihY/virulence factor BrkB family protein [Cellulomonas fengjieae]MBO3086432.1 YihY/virulence factor BrkB family protein [Cellulomonas fengjieae]MBO3100428.1 YihY/virulence factor BrkB family protein [Cellulomonas fengjieae]QVI66702.1 YihY/virulence factor BrkB family protein [Cellulomonas fengjieae]